MNRVANYIANGGNDRDRLLAEADYCAALAQSEADDGDPIGMYQSLAEEAFRLRDEAAESGEVAQIDAKTAREP